MPTDFKHDELLNILVNSVNTVFSLNSPLNIFIPPPDTMTDTNVQTTTINVSDKPQYDNSLPHQVYTEK